MLIRSAIIVVLISVLALVPTAVSAQYPPPCGTCLITVSNPNPDANSTITVTVTAAHPDGSPKVGIPLSLILTGQGASVTPATVITDANGQAVFTVKTGGDGILKIETDCECSKPIAFIPVGDQPTPPPTGSGTGIAHERSSGGGLFMPLLGLSLLVLGGGSWALATNRRRN